MPARKDIKRVLVLGSGPIRIGQACEFDYSGTQACKALKEDGYEVVLVNSNPATIMTDPELANSTYIEPLTVEYVSKIIAAERPCALLPTVGGQTALNLARELSVSGTLKEYDVELIGASLESITIAEDRERFRSTMQEIGIAVPRSVVLCSMEELENQIEEIPLPAILRSAFTMGGTGSSIVTDRQELSSACRAALRASPVSEVLIEESIAGWKEIELEVVRDRNDNFIVVCGIENFDPMGVHTGDSITVAPIQTLTDREYQALRNAARMIIRAIGIDCGGANIQFAINPANGDFVAIEMNPRVSRSSALASKATGYPIARVAAKLAVGYTLDELENEIIGSSACFEPTLDYVVTKIPRFNFDKFYGTPHVLGTEMRSVGEVMAIGRTFKESMQKALRGLELKMPGYRGMAAKAASLEPAEWKRRLATPSPNRVIDIFCAFHAGLTLEDVQTASSIDIWFLEAMKEIFDLSNRFIADVREVIAHQLPASNAAESKEVKDIDLLELIPENSLRELKISGFGDSQIAELISVACGPENIAEVREESVRKRRKFLGIEPTFNAIDTCAGEFATSRRYHYSTFDCDPTESAFDAERENACTPSAGIDSGSRPHSINHEPEEKKVVILGGGPNRIGQGIEFDYCCVRAVTVLRNLGYKTVMVNCNPETVSTDSDVSDSLYFEPLTLENVCTVLEVERPVGVIVQFGGQTPLNIAEKISAWGYKIMGTSCESIAMAEDRGQFKDLLADLNIRQPESLIVTDRDEAMSGASALGYPVIIRPSYVLGGQSMFIAYSRESMESIANELVENDPDKTFLIDRFLENAVEVDVDAVSDGKDVIIAGIMQHIEPAGVHSGDSSCIYPPLGLSDDIQRTIADWTRKIARRLNVIGLLNIQIAIKDGDVYVLEVNPRASRTVPFISKASGIPWVSIAVRLIMGEYLEDIRHEIEAPMDVIAVKSPCIPFERFPGSAICLAPEMRSTGEVMGLGSSLAEAFSKASVSAGGAISASGTVLVRTEPGFLDAGIDIARRFQDCGWTVFAGAELHHSLQSLGLEVELFSEGTIEIDRLMMSLQEKGVSTVVALSSIGLREGELSALRRATVARRLPLIMTVQEAQAFVTGIESLKEGQVFEVASLQERQSRRKSQEIDDSSDVAGYRSFSA